jgi:hypothetical protein
MRKLKKILYLSLVALMTASVADATFIKCEIKNASDTKATGFQVMFLSKGVMQNARLDGIDHRASLQAVNVTPNEFVWKFDRGVGAGEKLKCRLEFSPEHYWENVFDNRFTYAGGEQRRGVIPYAGFFIYFTPTSDPDKVLATLTIRKNHQGIDDPLIPIAFKNCQVYVNNDQANYKLERFDRPTGKKLDLPDSFTLGPGEERNFNLGVVKAGSYVYTRSTISYEGSADEYELGCAHSYMDELSRQKVALLKSK